MAAHHKRIHWIDWQKHIRGYQIDYGYSYTQWERDICSILFIASNEIGMMNAMNKHCLSTNNNNNNYIKRTYEKQLTNIGSCATRIFIGLKHSTPDNCYDDILSLFLSSIVQSAHIFEPKRNVHYCNISNSARFRCMTPAWIKSNQFKRRRY